MPVNRLASGSCACARDGFEGYVAKDEASPYEGGPMRRWLKGEAEGLDGRRGPVAATIFPEGER